MIQTLSHVWQLLLFLVLLSGPIPLSLGLISLQKGDPSEFRLSGVILRFLTYWCVFQVCIGLIMGISEQFFLYPVLLAELVLLGLGLGLLLVQQRQKGLSFFAATIAPSFSIAELSMVAAISFTGAILLKRLSTLPIINYDSLWYHLPIMARWYQEGTFVRMPDFMNTGLWTTDQIIYYPFNWEILCTLFMMPFKEDFWVALPNLVAWIMLGLAIYRLGDLVGAQRVYNLAAVALVLTIPLIIQHINSLHIDLPFTTFFVVSLYFALSYHKTRSPFDITLFILSIGMLLGIKMSAVGYGVLPVFALLALEVRSLYVHKRLPQWSNTSPQLTAFAFMLGLVCCVLIGGFWYIRNWTEVGNPLGNVEVKIAGITFPGTVTIAELRETSLAALFQFTNSTHLKILLTQSIVRLQLPFLALIVQAIFLPALLFPRKRQLQTSPLVITGLLLLGTAYLYWTTPMTGTNLLPPGPISPYIGQQMRFAIPVIALLGIVAAAIATVVQTRLTIVVSVVLLSSLLGTLSNSIFDILRTETAFKARGAWASKILDGFRVNPGKALQQVTDLLGGSLFDLIGYVVLFVLLIAFIIWLASRQRDSAQYFVEFTKLLQRSSKFIFPVLFIGLLVASTAVARQQRNVERQEVYRGIYEFVDRSVQPNETVGYLFSTRSYLLYGKALDQKVAYTPAPSDSVTGWINNLRQKNVGVVAVGPLEAQMGWEKHPEVEWLKNSQYFVRVFGQDLEKEIVLYRINAS